MLERPNLGFLFLLPLKSLQKSNVYNLYDAVENGVLTEARIDESVFRILSAKLRVTDWSI